MWKCKLCEFSTAVKVRLMSHYRLLHGQHSTICPLACPYHNCMCYFKTYNSLKVHMSRVHDAALQAGRENIGNRRAFKCQLCEFTQPFVERDMFLHLGRHLKQKQIVPCPFKDCSFTSNVYSTFTSHKCREHSNSSDYATELVQPIGSDPPQNFASEEESVAFHEEEPSHEEVYDTDALDDKLEYNLAAFFLKMQSILHVTNRATQEIVEHIDQLFTLSEPILNKVITETLKKHSCPVTDTIVGAVVQAVSECNILHRSVKSKGPLSTAKRRKSYVEQRFPHIKPIEYLIDRTQRKSVYVPVLSSLQELMKKADIADIAFQSTTTNPGEFSSYVDGSYYQSNVFFAEGGAKFSLILYVDDLEIANPLGTSRGYYKMCAVYWSLANLPIKYRSALHTIQLAMLCNSKDVQRFGYDKVFAPLLNDLKILEQDGVYIENLGDSIKGTVFSVVADNLAAHGLGGFNQSFRSVYSCRFCLYSRADVQTLDATIDACQMRSTDQHDALTQEIQENENAGETYGVKGTCVFSDQLSYFHTITGFPPDILHDLLEGVVPVELALCLQGMISLNYFTLQDLNKAIKSFPYQHSDKVDRPHPIPSFSSRGTIGGNGHENHALLRLLPILIGHNIPEGDMFWEILMALKDVVDLAVSHKFTEETLQYMSCKISEHRQILQEVFPNLMLRPKHHFLEHYPHLIRCFGPLVHLWTMRFEGKHRVFKKIIHESNNFKNVLKTCAERHQLMMTYYLSSSRFFKPPVEMSQVKSVFIDTLPSEVQASVSKFTEDSTVLSTNQVNIDGTSFVVGMFVCTGVQNSLPEFKEIINILLLANRITLLLKDYNVWYVEHLRSFELTVNGGNGHVVCCVRQLKDHTPLYAYRVSDRLILTPKHFIPMASPLKLRIVLDDQNAEKLILPSRPETVDDLISEIKTRFELLYDFRLQYEDPDFNNALCNLVSIESLPSIATVKVVHLIDLDLSSISTDDTVILSSPERSCRTEAWPENFTVPSFTYDIEYILSKGNTAYEQEGKTLKLTKDQKHNILEAMAIEMYKYTGYPSGKQFGKAAEALVKKHACLKEKTGTGYDGWKNSLRFKMGNYRTKLSRAGVKDVSVNAGKRSRINPTAASSHSNIKRPRRGEINYLPDYPAGESKESLEAQRNELSREFEKVAAERDGALIFLLMHRTFALRREEIINSSRPIAELRERWPALFCEAQLYKEVHRITNQNLPFSFFASLDRYTPHLLNLYKQKQSGTFGQKMVGLLSDYSKQDKNNVQAARTAVLFGLALYLKEDTSEVFRSCKEADFDKHQKGAVVLLAVTEENASAVPFSPQHVTIILEDQVVLSHRYWADALVILFGLIYALHLEYPEKLKGFFEFIQIVLLNLDDGRRQIKPKLLSLKNELELSV
ncbi:hypothetical protein ACEWY4_025731 [Coilia grayii]|uniref:C2H2-type domain-containing protein n=1 Tax=Coilia grayii TaxID=363190 RepID=A0ABD1IUV1_9TELE